MESLIVFTLRIVFGLILASALSVCGFIMGYGLWPPSSGPSSLAIFLAGGAAIGAGIGGFMAWFKPGEAWSIILVTLGLALVGSLAGASGGLMFARLLYGGPLSSQAARIPTVLSAGVAANILPFIAHTYWARRGRRR